MVALASLSQQVKGCDSLKPFFGTLQLIKAPALPQVPLPSVSRSQMQATLIKKHVLQQALSVFNIVSNA